MNLKIVLPNWGYGILIIIYYTVIIIIYYTVNINVNINVNIILTRSQSNQRIDYESPSNHWAS